MRCQIPEPSDAIVCGVIGAFLRRRIPWIPAGPEGQTRLNGKPGGGARGPGIGTHPSPPPVVGDGAVCRNRCGAPAEVFRGHKPFTKDIV